MRTTKISWTDGTKNFWEGCTKVSSGCANCYAETRDRRFHDGEHWGMGRPRKKSVSALANLVREDQAADRGDFIECECGIRHWAKTPCECGNRTGRPTRIVQFVMSLGDFFDPEVPDDWRLEALIAMMDAKASDFMVLTKRPHLVLDLLGKAAAIAPHHVRERIVAWIDGIEVPLNIAIGTSIESHHVATARLEALTTIPAARRFVSAEPLLECWGAELIPFAPLIDLVIVGGESGAAARPMNPAWAQFLEVNCDVLGIGFHFKQWGEWIPSRIVEADWTLPHAGNLMIADVNGFSKFTPEKMGEASSKASLIWRIGKSKSARLDVENTLTADGRTRTERLAFPLDNGTPLFTIAGPGNTERPMTYRSAKEWIRAQASLPSKFEIVPL